MHPALEVADSAWAEQPAPTLSDYASTRWRRQGQAWLWVAGLVVLVSLSLADSLVAGVVPYERDTAVFYFPLMSWLGQQLATAQFPLWTPQFFGGYPIFADGEIGLAYPPVLLALVMLPPDRAFVILRLLHLSLAAIGMFLLARTWRLPYPSAALAGVVFTFGNFLQAQIHHENIIRTASWLPLILTFVELALRSSTSRARLRWTALAAGSLGLAGLSLHSQMLAIDLLILAAYGAFRWAVGPVALRPLLRPWLARFVSVATVCLPVLVLGLGLAAVQLVPLVELAGFSARGGGIPYSQSAAYSVTTLGLVQLVFPYVFRGPGNVQWGLWTHWESYLYIGLAPLILAIVALACVRRREVAGWAAIGAVGLILSLGQYSPLNLHYYLWLLPGMSGLRAPGRFTFVVILAGAMLAAYGLSWLIQQARFSGGRVRGLLGGLSIAVIFVAGFVVAVHAAMLAWPAQTGNIIQSAYLALPRDTYPLTVADVFNGLMWSTDLRNPHVAGALGGLVMIVGALWLWQQSRCRTWRGWPTVFVGMAAADLLVFGWAIHPREPLAKISAEPPAVQAVEQLPHTDAAPNRVLASPVLNQVAPDRLAPFGTVEEANGYSSLQFVWHSEYLGRVLYADDPLLDLWNVRYILDPARYGALLNFDDVNFLPQQALLHAPAGGALAEQQFALRSSSPVSQLRFVTALVGAVDIPQGAPVAEVELRDAANQVVGTAELLAGRDTMDWAWDAPSIRPIVKHQRVQVAGMTSESSGPEPRTRALSFAGFEFSTPVAAQSLVVRAIPSVGEFVMYGGAAIGRDGAVDQLFDKAKTKYQQVYADGEMRVLENTAAFPRAFVVPRARVAPSLGTALSQMVHEPFQPGQEVILAGDTPTQLPGLVTDRGGTGSAQVISYSDNAIQVHTSASADAWLVLSDTYYPGWTASIDGQPMSVLRGDVLFRVVPIPAGEHNVEFRFAPSSVTLGLLVSLGSLALLVLVFVFVFAGRSAMRRRTT